MPIHPGLVACLQATPDHFNLTGDKNPTYKRAGAIKPGETVWLLDAQDSTKLTQARINATTVVQNTGMYAPMTLSGSIIVNNVVASVHRCAGADGLLLHLKDTCIRQIWLCSACADAWVLCLVQAHIAHFQLNMPLLTD